MSGNNWLELDPSQSPGLRRIQEAQQAATLAKAQEAQRALAERLAKEAAEKDLRNRESHREMVVKQRISEISPLLAEIRDFANKTKTYPVSETYVKWHKGDSQELIEAAETRITKVDSDGFGYIDVSYAHRGKAMRAEADHDPDSVHTHYHYVDFPAACFDGIRIRMSGDTGAMELLSHREVLVPSKKPTADHWTSGGRSSGFVHGEPGWAEHIEQQNFWNSLPSDKHAMRQALADAFHDPMQLDTQELFESYARPEVSQRGDKILESFLESAKGILHFMFG